MPDLVSILAGVATTTALWTLVGLPLAARTLPSPLAWFAAPALGWAVHAALSLTVFSAFGMSRLIVIGTTVAFTAMAAAALWRQRHSLGIGRPSVVVIAALAAAFLLALVPMAGVLPKVVGDGIALAPPIFDHSKIALVDEIIRAGVPPTNPVYGEIGLPQGVSYYYAWHFSAAVMAVLTGLTGWEADAGLTWFTAFASLLLTMGLAISFGGRTAAPLLAVALAATGSARAVLAWFVGPDTAYALVGEASGFGGWLFQVSWAPQHVAAATCVVTASCLLVQMRDSKDRLTPLVLGAVAAAGFQSSIWVGGVTFAVAAGAFGIAVLLLPGQTGRARFAAQAVLAVALAIAFAAPLLRAQMAVAPLRGGGMPIAVSPVDALGEAFPRLLDLPGYWLVYLPLEFPAFYAAGVATLVALWRRHLKSQPAAPMLPALTLFLAVSLVAAWLLASTVGSNNDLGWRAVLPAVMLLIALAAAGISRIVANGRYAVAASAAAGVILGLPQATLTVRENIAGDSPTAAAADFARSPLLWRTVRRHAAEHERVANDPRLFAEMTPWPVNISWALLANRRSCYAAIELAVAFAPLSALRRGEVDALFARVFDGEPVAGDIAQLAGRFRCDVVVVTSRDKAWRRDPFAGRDVYRLVEDAPAWRIYHRTGWGG